MSNCICDAEALAVYNLNNRCYLTPRGALICEGCGESFPMPGGMAGFVAAVIDAFCKAHERCQRGDKYDLA